MSGGLALWWKNDLVVEILHYSKNHFHSLLTTSDDSGVKCVLTGIYKPLETLKRFLTWDFLKIVKPTMEIPWVVFGDFNEILTLNEKWGGRDRPEGQMETFRDVLSIYGLHDLGYLGKSFTWCNNRENEHRISKRLDWFLANQ